MAQIIDMPKLSDTMVTGRIVSWVINEGDTVSSGDTIAEVETDKATMDLDTFDEGVLLKILAQVDDAVPVGGPIAILGEEGEDIAGLIEEAKSMGDKAASDANDDQQENTKSETKESKPEPKKEDQPAPAAKSDSPKPSSGGKLKASPVAQRLAAEHGINLQSIEGSGPGGRVVKKDVEAAISGGGGGGQAPVSSIPAMQISGEPYEDIALSSVRSTIAQRLPQSLGPVPHFYLEVDVDAEPIMKFKKQVQELAGDVKVTLTDVIIKACTVALKKHPMVNSQYNGSTVRRFNVVNMGIAVAGPGTLLVPVIKNCEMKGLTDIAQDRAVLVQKGQEGKVSGDDMAGATFTISNLGMMGITRFQAIINPPQGAIMAVGAIRDEPVVKDGAVVPGKKMSFTISCDHRVMDGADAAYFMQTLAGIIENPVGLCM